MIKIFLASSSELKEDREQFEIFINRKNKDWVGKSIFLNLIVWEDFIDALSQTRLQDEYNKIIRECDIFMMLFSTKVGQYTEEEFETAFGQFKVTNKPFIFTYFKDVEISTGKTNKKDLMSLWAFMEKLDKLDHFYTVYQNIDELKFKFNQQLDKLAANGFIELASDKSEVSAPSGILIHESTNVLSGIPSAEEMRYARTEIEREITLKAVQEAKTTIQHIFIDAINTKTALLEIRTRIMRLLRKILVLSQSCNVG